MFSANATSRPGTHSWWGSQLTHVQNHCFILSAETCLNIAGYDDVKTIVILGSDAALRKVQGSRSLLGADLDVIVGKGSAVVQSDVSQTQAIPYSMADGALIDFSVKGVHSSLQHAG